MLNDCCPAELLGKNPDDFFFFFFDNLLLELPPPVPNADTDGPPSPKGVFWRDTRVFFFFFFCAGVGAGIGAGAGAGALPPFTLLRLEINPAFLCVSRMHCFLLCFLIWSLSCLTVTIQTPF
jgi:hypothetical protein